ncbi:MULTISPECIES: hypothetical protein [unclassified Flavobacterium]|uniref:hypothetical protein n=1 Tax=unclassified Flavobacterium TaxID=196869 RepID=UPI001F1494A3|nr:MULTISPECIES: hypothetical protein [unclassified Flavobacterium]UMY65775.1 hypothetical protein MKO97_14950 [Flavobacterium sp. HJ-32-4]
MRYRGIIPFFLFRKRSFIFLFFLVTTAYAQVTYPQRAFDSDTCCWRVLATKGHYVEAAQRIEDFLADGHPDNRQSLRWHAGQLYAFAGENKKALRYLRSTYSVFQKWFGDADGAAWYRFAKGTCAFLRRDRTTLDRQITRWKKNLPSDANLRELERLQARWDQPYRLATQAIP